MPKTINWPDSAAAIARWFGLKGSVSLQADEIVVPTMQVGDIVASPYATNPTLGHVRQVSAAVALENSGLLAVPAAGTILEIQVVEVNQETNADSPFTFRYINPADIALCTVNATSNFRNSQSPRGPNLQNLASTMLSVSHAGLLGQGIWRRVVQASAGQENWARIERGPGGPLLYLSGDAGLGGAVLWNETLNQDCPATFWAREWKVPG